MPGELALALAVVFAVNLLPAFGPPTWAVLVFFGLQFDLPAVPLVLGGALAAASGRYLFASGARALRPAFSAARLERLDLGDGPAAGDAGGARSAVGRLPPGEDAEGKAVGFPGWDGASPLLD